METTDSSGHASAISPSEPGIDAPPCVLRQTVACDDEDAPRVRAPTPLPVDDCAEADEAVTADPTCHTPTTDDLPKTPANAGVAIVDAVSRELNSRDEPELEGLPGWQPAAPGTDVAVHDTDHTTDGTTNAGFLISAGGEIDHGDGGTVQRTDTTSTTAETEMRKGDAAVSTGQSHSEGHVTRTTTEASVHGSTSAVAGTQPHRLLTAEELQELKATSTKGKTPNASHVSLSNATNSCHRLLSKEEIDHYLASKQSPQSPSKTPWGCNASVNSSTGGGNHNHISASDDVPQGATTALQTDAGQPQSEQRQTNSSKSNEEASLSGGHVVATTATTLTAVPPPPAPALPPSHSTSSAHEGNSSTSKAGDGAPAANQSTTPPPPPPQRSNAPRRRNLATTVSAATRQVPYTRYPNMPSSRRLDGPPGGPTTTPMANVTAVVAPPLPPPPPPHSAYLCSAALPSVGRPPYYRAPPPPQLPVQPLPQESVAAPSQTPSSYYTSYNNLRGPYAPMPRQGARQQQQPTRVGGGGDAGGRGDLGVTTAGVHQQSPSTGIATRNILPGSRTESPSLNTAESSKAEQWLESASRGLSSRLGGNARLYTNNGRIYGDDRPTTTAALAPNPICVGGGGNNVQQNTRNTGIDPALLAQYNQWKQYTEYMAYCQQYYQQQLYEQQQQQAQEQPGAYYRDVMDYAAGRERTTSQICGGGGAYDEDVTTNQPTGAVGYGRGGRMNIKGNESYGYGNQFSRFTALHHRTPRSKPRSSHDNTPQEKKYSQCDPFSMYKHNKMLELEVGHTEQEQPSQAPAS